MNTLYKKFAVNDLVKPGRKKNPGWNESATYSSLDSETIYKVIEVVDRNSGWQSVRLEPYLKSSKFKPNVHAGFGRFYAADNMNSATYKGSNKAVVGGGVDVVDSSKPNLATEILGKSVLVAPTLPAYPGIAPKAPVLPTRIVVDTKTGLVVYKEDVGRSAFIGSRSAFDKTQTGNVDRFIADELRKNPIAEFAVYTLEKIGKVSEIKVRWE